MLEDRCQQPCVTTSQKGDVPPGHVRSGHVTYALQSKHRSLEGRQSSLVATPQPSCGVQQIYMTEGIQR